MRYFYLLVLFILNSKTPAQELRFVENELWGLKDSLGNIVLYPQYQFISKFHYNTAIVAQNDLLGAINKEGHLIMPIEYEFLQQLDTAEFLFGYRAKYVGEYTMGVINIHQEVIISPEYSIIGKHNGFYGVVIRKDSILGKDPNGDLRSGRLIHGILDQKGQEVLPCEFDIIHWKNDTLLAARKLDTYTLYSIKGEQLTYQPYTFIGDFIDGIASVRLVNKCGYINAQGDVIIPIEFDRCTDFDKGYALINKGEKWGAINTHGELVIEAQHEFDEAKKLVEKFNGS